MNHSTKTIFITTSSDEARLFQLKRSLDHYGWGYHFIIHEWKGFGDKIIETYNYLKANPDVTHFFYSDAWDTVVCGTMAEALNKVGKRQFLFSAEKACYPHPDKADRYPETKSTWKYLNGGGWYCSSELFCKMVEAVPLDSSVVDQVYFTDRFLDGIYGIELDNNCAVFQTLAFSDDSEFELSDRLHNKATGTISLFIHGNGHTPMDKIYDMLPMFSTLKEVADIWKDDIDLHRLINEQFTKNVNNIPALKEYRDWIETNIFGFGERSFLWMWKLLVDTQGANFSFLEIGVFRGQILGLIRMLAPFASITGITPLTNEGGHWDSDYADDIKNLHDTFKLKQPEIIKGLSTDTVVVVQAGMYDIVYIDGGHSYEVAKSDIFIYSSHVKVGGYLVVDDCSHKYNLPDGYFKGIADVSRAVDELLPNDYYVELFNVMHNRVFKRVK